MNSTALIVLGIDPGLFGALAWFSSERMQLEVLDMPIVRSETKGNTLAHAQLGVILRERHADFAFIEEVHSMPAQGIASSFKFGEVYGAAKQAVASRGLPLTTVRPQLWKRDVGIAEASRHDKAASRMRAMNLFPLQSALFARAKDDGRAEAALIAYWGFLQLRGSIAAPAQQPVSAEETP